MTHKTRQKTKRYTISFEFLFVCELYITMTDTINMLKAELGIKSNKHEHHHHHHGKIIIPNKEATENVTHELQSQLGQGKEVDREVQQEKHQGEDK